MAVSFGEFIWCFKLNRIPPFKISSNLSTIAIRNQNQFTKNCLLIRDPLIPSINRWVCVCVYVINWMIMMMRIVGVRFYQRQQKR